MTRTGEQMECGVSLRLATNRRLAVGSACGRDEIVGSPFSLLRGTVHVRAVLAQPFWQDGSAHRRFGRLHWSTVKLYLT